MIVVPRFRGFVRILTIACVVVFVVEQFVRYGPAGDPAFFGRFVEVFGLVPSLFFKGAVYQPITWIFLHANLMHLIFNMFALWMFGSLLEESWGQRRFTKFVFIAAFFSGLIVATWGLFDPFTFTLPTIGASGVVFAILMAVSRVYPDQIVLFLFVFPMRMKYFAYLMVLLEFYALYTSNDRGISNVAHLGGALVGFIYGSWSNRFKGSSSGGGWFKNLKDRIHQRRMRKKLRVIRVRDSSSMIH